jgi:hypothetical protein
MGLFDVFKKKECCICGNEVGLIGNRKLEDGNMCSKCAKKLSPWFDDRRHSTMEQIRQQLTYREQNARELEGFNVSRTIGESNKMYIEEVNGIPTRFFVTGSSNYKDANPDIISFKDVVSCVTDIDIRDEEKKQRDSEGRMVSYNPPRFEHHYNFYIKMQIRNNPYFDDIKFRVNSNVVTLESVGGIGGVGTIFGGSRNSIGRSMAGPAGFSLNTTREHKRYNEYHQMCELIEQAVEDGKRGAFVSAQTTNVQDPALVLLAKIPTAKMEELDPLLKEISELTCLRPDYNEVKEIQDKAVKAVADRANQLHMMRTNKQTDTAAAAAPQVPAGPKFCTYCGAPADGGKFCQYCGCQL